jgi:hypothetical protein
MTKERSGRLAAAGVLAAVGLAISQRTVGASAPIAPAPCASDSSFQRLAFWIGDWDVYDSTGTRYASQRVRSAVDACAITAEWSGPIGDRGMSVTAYDPRTRDWRQVYVTNQVPAVSGVSMRKSDPSYAGPGLRFIPVAEATPDNTSRLRITIAPAPERRVRQTFEESRDGGMTWRVLFTAEHRPK